MSKYYHYCNVDAFLNIVRNKILWLSDIDKSNDPWEGRNVFQNILDYYSYNRSDEEFDKNDLSRLIERIMNYDCERRLYQNFHAYAICFSKNGDLLSQWRGYTKDAAGISIGFDGKVLERWSYSFHGKKIAEFRAIQYGEKKQEIKDTIRELLELEKDIGSYECTSDSDIYTHPFYQYLEERAIDGYFIKDKGFHEEKEKRLIYREYYRFRGYTSIGFLGTLFIFRSKQSYSRLFS